MKLFYLKTAAWSMGASALIIGGIYAAIWALGRFGFSPWWLLGTMFVAFFGRAAWQDWRAR